MMRISDTNRTRLVRKAKNVDSFFNFFSPPTPPSEDAIASGNIDDEELEAVEEQLEIDYQIGEDLKEKVSSDNFFFPHAYSAHTDAAQIIPRAVDWFTGRALEFEGFDDDDDDFASLEDDDEDAVGFEDVSTVPLSSTERIKVTDGEG